MPKIPGVNHLKAVRAFERVGFRVIRQSKHIIMAKGDRTIVIPRANPINAITMYVIARDAGPTVEEFKRLL